MGSPVKKGLAALREKRAQEVQKAAERDRPKANWFTQVFTKETGKNARIVFLQELDESDPGYDEKRGLAVAAVEHQAPGNQGYKRRATCTLESEGQCYACEKHAENPKEGWRQRTNFYVNVAVEGFDGAYVLSRNFNSIFDFLEQEVEDEGSLTNAVYRVTKSGEGTQTKWTFKRLKEEPWDTSDIEVWDLEDVVLHDVEYDKQPAFYGAVYSKEDPEKAFAAPEPNKDVSEDW